MNYIPTANRSDQSQKILRQHVILPTMGDMTLACRCGSKTWAIGVTVKNGTAFFHEIVCKNCAKSVKIEDMPMVCANGETGVEKVRHFDWEKYSTTFGDTLE
jgi:hypothetical protein